MSDTTPLLSEKSEVYAWGDTVNKAYMTFLYGYEEVSLGHLVEREPKDMEKLKRSIFKIKEELERAPIGEVELLMILLALHKTSDAVKIMWRRTIKGQAIKETYIAAKKSFLRNGIIDEA